MSTSRGQIDDSIKKLKKELGEALARAKAAEGAVAATLEASYALQSVIDKAPKSAWTEEYTKARDAYRTTLSAASQVAGRAEDKLEARILREFVANNQARWGWEIPTAAQLVHESLIKQAEEAEKRT